MGILIAISSCAQQEIKSTASGDAAVQSPSTLDASSTPSSADAAAYLSAHNIHRAKHGASALVWSDTLASRAQDWANRCVFEHSSTSLAVGENLFRWTGSRTPKSAVDLWYNENSDYDYVAGAPKTPGAVTGHFTQIVWKGTSELGCGLANCPSIGNFLVCNYGPAGNVRGRYTSNVSAPN